jgi:PAS domain S-box-containing protein
VGREGLIVFANQHAGRLFGYEPGQLVGLEIEALIPERYRQRHVELRAEFSVDPVVCPMGTGRELRALRSDGHDFPVEVGLGPTDRGECVVAVVRDLTQVLATREDLGESQERVRSILHSLDSHVALLNREGEIIAINEAWDDFARENGAESTVRLGVGADYLGAYRRAADDDPDAQSAFSGIRSVLDGSRSQFTIEYPCHSPSQRRWFSMSVTPVRTKEGGVVVAHTDVTEKVLARQERERAMADLARSKDQLQAETEYLREDLSREHGFDEIVEKSDVMVATLQKVEQAAKTDATVLLLGETGTGKELLAHALHTRSNRKNRPLVKIDCATLPSGLVESELFGYEKGAFTGAHETKAGRFELADGGTVFLDEIGELSLDLQAKLLRVLQEGEFQRLGSKHAQKVDVRIIAATNRDLRNEVREGRFRSDLYYRLSVFPLESPPLRERREDIPLLASYFLSRFRATLGKSIDAIAKSSMDVLVAYDWPGNIRELQSVIERSAILCSGDTLTVQEALGDVAVPHREPASSLRQDLEGVESANILRALEESGWKVKGEGNAASRLGLRPSTLRSRMKKLGITRR